MTMTATPDWDEDLHPRISDGTFTEKQHTAPEVGLTAGDEFDEPERDYKPRYRMPANHQGLAEKKIAEANAKLAKLGISERFTFEVESSTETRNGQRYEYVTLVLDRPSISFEGWAFTGAHDFTPAGEVVNFRTTADAPKVVDNHCDHCGSTRARNRVYSVVHPEKGPMQVGASCLEAFLGMTPKGLWALTSELELDDIERTTGDVFDIRSRVYDPEELMVAALAASDDGREYISASNARYDQVPTAVAVGRDWAKLLASGNTKERGILARKVIRWARKLEEEPGSYLGNIHSIFAGKREEVLVREKHFGLAVSAVTAYRRAMDGEVVRQVKEKQKASVQKAYLAPKGEKIAGVSATVLHVIHDTSSYGYQEKDTTWIKLLTDDGHILSWNASSYRPEEVGDKVLITGATVKDTAIKRDDEHTTVLTRTKMEKVSGS